MPASFKISTASRITPSVEPQPINVTAAPGVRMTGHTRNRARRNAAFGIFVTLVTIRPLRGISGNDHLSPIDFRVEGELFGVNGRTALREQQVAEDDSWTLETISEVVHFGNESEAIKNIGRRHDQSREVAESSAQHLP